MELKWFHCGRTLRRFRFGSTMNLNELNHRWCCCFDMNYDFHVILIYVAMWMCPQTMASCIRMLLNPIMNYDGTKRVLFRSMLALLSSINFELFDTDETLPETISRHHHRLGLFVVISLVNGACKHKTSKLIFI